MTAPAPRTAPLARPSAAARALRLGLPVILPVVLLCAFALATAHLNRRLLRERATLHLTQAPPTENLPPAAALTTIALGGFRGLLADYLWIRASDLQDAGRYFELVQLSTWISRLQPRSPAIWTFHAWNLAYNIPSVMTAPEDRWPWILAGIHLLRDDAATACPDSPAIQRQLAWFFLHKLGTNLDPAAPYYRRQWAPLAQDLLDAATPPFDPATIARVRAEVAPLTDADLLLPQAAAILYAQQSLWQDPPPLPRDDLALRRTTYQALFQLIEAGRFDLAPPALAYIRAAAARHPSNPALRSLLLRLSPHP